MALTQEGAGNPPVRTIAGQAYLVRQTGNLQSISY